eukprot:Skav207443  [mRNA]  locus=scaffold1959:262261:262866:- [translate_table: standard]
MLTARWRAACAMVGAAYDRDFDLVVIQHAKLVTLTDDGIAGVLDNFLQQVHPIGVVVCPTLDSSLQPLELSLVEHGSHLTPYRYGRVNGALLVLARCLGVVGFGSMRAIPWAMFVPGSSFVVEPALRTWTWISRRCASEALKCMAGKDSCTASPYLMWHSDALPVDIQLHLWKRDSASTDEAWSADVIDSFWQTCLCSAFS